MEPYPGLHQTYFSFSPSLFSLLCLQESLHPDKILQEDIFFGAGPWDSHLLSWLLDLPQWWMLLEELPLKAAVIALCCPVQQAQYEQHAGGKIWA